MSNRIVSILKNGLAQTIIAILATGVVTAITARAASVKGWITQSGWAIAVIGACPAAVIGLVVGYRLRGRRRLRAEPVPTASPVPYVKLRVPYDLGRPGVAKTAHSVRLLTEADCRMSWDLFHDGVRALQLQCQPLHQLGNEPRLIAIGVNRGAVAIADLLRGNHPWLLGDARIATDPETGARRLARLNLPSVERPQEYSVLLVDTSMKTGSSLEVVKKGLEEKGFIADRMTAAVLAFVNTRFDPHSLVGTTVDLSPESFRPLQTTELLSYRPWLSRLYYIAFLSPKPIDPPWNWSD